MAHKVTVVVSIGLEDRLGDPLSEDRQVSLRAHIHDTLDTVGKVYFQGEGRGYTERWGEEPSHTWVAEFPEDCLDELRRLLVNLAIMFDQDAIALTVGATEFCEPEGSG